MTSAHKADVLGEKQALITFNAQSSHNGMSLGF